MALVFEVTDNGCTLAAYCDRCVEEVAGDDGVLLCMPFDADLVQTPMFVHRTCLDEWLEERGPIDLPAVVDLVALPAILLSVLMVDSIDSERAAKQYAPVEEDDFDPEELDEDDD